MQIQEHLNEEDGLCQGSWVRTKYAAAFNFLSIYEIIDSIVDQNNVHATQVSCDKEDISNESRLHGWVPTDRKEILKFIGLVGYMGTFP